MIKPYQKITQIASFIFLDYVYFQIVMFLDFLRVHQSFPYNQSTLPDFSVV